MSRNQISPKTRFRFFCCLLLFSLTILVISHWAGWTAHWGYTEMVRPRSKPCIPTVCWARGWMNRKWWAAQRGTDSLKNSEVIRISLLHLGAKALILLQNEAIFILSVYAGCLYLRSASSTTHYTWSHFSGVSEIMWPFLALSLFTESGT